MPDLHALGPHLRSFHTATAHRRRTGVVQVVLGPPLLIVAIVILWLGFAAHLVLGGAILGALFSGTGVASLINGIINLRAAVAHQDEVFELYAGGVVHRYRGGSEVLPWADIATAHDSGKTAAAAFPGTADGRGRLVGWDTFCVVRLTDGRRLVISDFTEGAFDLARAVTASVPDSTPPRDAVVHAQLVGGFATAAVLAAAATVVVAVYLPARPVIIAVLVDLVLVGTALAVFIRRRRRTRR